MNAQKYVGRVLSVAMSPSGQLVGMYRVASRSFTNREIVVEGSSARVKLVASVGSVESSNYVEYECLSVVGNKAILSNGSHTTPIAGRIRRGDSTRDAICATLVGMDYEFDSLATPRIACVLELGSSFAWLGIVSTEQICVKRLELVPRRGFYVATYHKTEIAREQSFDDFVSEEPSDYNRFVTKEGPFAEMSHGVCALTVVGDQKWFAESFPLPS